MRRHLPVLLHINKNTNLFVRLHFVLDFARLSFRPSASSVLVVDNWRPLWVEVWYMHRSSSSTSGSLGLAKCWTKIRRNKQIGVISKSSQDSDVFRLHRMHKMQTIVTDVRGRRYLSVTRLLSVQSLPNHFGFLLFAFSVVVLCFLVYGFIAWLTDILSVITTVHLLLWSEFAF